MLLVPRGSRVPRRGFAQFFATSCSTWRDADLIDAITVAIAPAIAPHRAKRPRRAARNYGNHRRAGAGTVAAIPRTMASTEAKAGFGLAWLLGIPLPILAIVYLISRC